MNENNINTEQQVEENELEEIITSSEELIKLEIEKEIIRMSKDISFENIEEFTTSSEFNKGLSEALELVGFYSTLVNFGISQKTAEDLTVNKHTYDYNTSLQKIINKNQLEIAKVQEVKITQGQTL